MFAKQQLCLTLLSLLISSLILPMENPEIKLNTNPKKRIPLSPLNTYPTPNHNDDTFTKKQKSTKVEQSKNKDVFEGISIKDLNFAFETAAPEDALDIVEHLKDPSLLDDGTDRSRFFVGEPGSGKTTVAKAIAYKMHTEAKWNYKFINSTEIFSLGSQQSSRNQAAINLGNLLKAIIEKNEPTLLIIDEVNQLLENADDPHFDTNTTSTLLWTFLDSQNYNDNFFFIGIANRLNKIPKPLKSRTILRTVRFKEITDPVVKRDLFLNKLLDRSTQLHSEVDNVCIEKLIKDTPGITGRDFHELALKARKLCWKEDRKNKLKIITKKHLTETFDIYVQEKELSEYDKIEQTDEERRHKESLDNNNRLHEDSKNNTNRIHLENVKKQDEHFIQQLLIQIASHGDFKDYSPHTMADNVCIDATRINGKSLFSAQDLPQWWSGKMVTLISDEQMQQYQDSMANTFKRRVDEKRIKEAKEAAETKKAEEEKKKNAWW